jgi:Holliday junction resolvasome RuvABC endonuclease subunit
VIAVGLDLSLNGTGAARVDTDTGGARTMKIDPKGLRGHRRLEFILEEITRVIQGADIVGIEGLSFASKSASRDELYGMHMLVRHQVWRRRVPYALLPPSTVKGYTTGNGQAGKIEMVKAMRSAFPAMKLPNDDDQADALAIAAMVLRWSGQIIDAHVTRWPHCLDGVEWPDHDREPRRVHRPKPISPLQRGK